MSDIIEEYVYDSIDDLENQEYREWVIKCFIDSFREAYLDAAIPEFLEELEDEAVDEKIIDSRIMVNVKHWIDYIHNYESISWATVDKDSMIQQIAEFMEKIYEQKMLGSLISMKKFIEFFEQSEKYNFRLWSEEEKLHCVRCLMQTFKEAACHCEWYDVLFEQLTNYEISNLSLKSWHTAQMKFLNPDIRDDVLLRHIEAAENFYKHAQVEWNNGYFTVALKPDRQ